MQVTAEGKRHAASGACQESEQWASFFAAWKRSYDFNSSVWANFFLKFADTKPYYGSLPIKREFYLEGYASFFSVFNQTWKKHRMDGRAINFWEVSGIGESDEVRHSAVLAWLLDARGSHGQGNGFLRALLAQLVINHPGSDLARLFAACSTGRYRTTVESSYHEETTEQFEKRFSRVDIEIDGEALLLFIEVKIRSGETGDQLQRYLNILKSRAGNRAHGLFFLTPRGKKPVEVSLHDEVLPISWRELAQIFSRHTTESMPCDSYGHNIINQFCEHIAEL